MEKTKSTISNEANQAGTMKGRYAKKDSNSSAIKESADLAVLGATHKEEKKRNLQKPKKGVLENGFGGRTVPEEGRKDRGIKEKPRLCIQMENDDSELDSEEEEVNRIGDVPLWWYNEEDHIGYTIEGKRLLKTIHSSAVDNLLNNVDNPDYWRTVVDVKNNKTIRLTDTDIHAIRRLREGRIPIPSFSSEDTFIEFDHPDKIFPTRNTPEPKSRFLPSKWEAKKITKLVRLIRSGRLQLHPKKPSTELAVFDLWGNALTERDTAHTKLKKALPHLPPPKLTLPGHSESYNAPPEYLFTHEEREEWEAMDPEDRSINFIPQLYPCLRHVPGYSHLIKERFDRCLDLYLCPRTLKLRMNVDPESLLPSLPPASNFKPFPTQIAVEYTFSYTPSLASSVHFQSTRCFTVDHYGHWLACGGDDRCLRIFEVLTGHLSLQWQLDKPITSLSWHPLLPILAIGIKEALYMLQIDLPNHRGEGILTKAGKRDRPKPEGAMKAYSTAHALLKVHKQTETESTHWQSIETEDSRNARVFRSQKGIVCGLHIRHETDIEQIAWHHRGHYVAVLCPSSSSPSKQCSIHALLLQRSIHPLRSTANGRVLYVSFHPSKPRFYAAYHNGIRIYDLQKHDSTTSPSAATKSRSALVQRLIGVDDISCFHIHPNGEHVIVGGMNRALSWFDMDLSNKPYKVLRHHKRPINAVGFHNHFPLLFSASADGSTHIIHAKVFDDSLQNPLIVPLKQLSHSDLRTTEESTIIAAAWHPSQPWIFTADKSGGIYLWV